MYFEAKGVKLYLPGGYRTMEKIRGVNLGNWLVLEKWMHPPLFHGVDAEDETDLCLLLSDDEKRARLKSTPGQLYYRIRFSLHKEYGNEYRTPTRTAFCFWGPP
jgi:glucan 1,3-beta-glucosidase